MTINFAINGFGRIGRTVLRSLIASSKHPNLNCVAINCGTSDFEANLHLLKYDSTYGTLVQNIERIDSQSISIDGKIIKFIFQNDPSHIDWNKHGVDVVFECTGRFTKAEQAKAHILAGAKKVLISAPSSGDVDATIVYGVNHKALKPSDQIISIGSCTTNCLAPVAMVLNDDIGIASGFMTTIHAYTNDQVLLDSTHHDLRRSRSATSSLIPSTTGAAKAIGLVIPELAGRLDGSSVRVPVSNVSMIELTFNSVKPTTAPEINALMQQAAASGLQGVLGYCDQPLVSVDFKQNPLSAIFDATLTKVIGENGTTCKVVAWYDNEWAFSHRMLDIASILGF